MVKALRHVYENWDTLWPLISPLAMLFITSEILPFIKRLQSNSNFQLLCNLLLKIYRAIKAEPPAGKE